MPEAGGPTAWSGLYFQGQVVLYDLIKMIWDQAQNEHDPITCVRTEAPSPVDDILVEHSSGRRLYQSAKEELRLSSTVDSPWGRLWKSIYEQRWRADFQAQRDRIEIVFPEKDSLRGSISELTSRAAAANDLSEFKSRLSQDHRRLFDALIVLLQTTEEQALALLRVIRVRFIGDPQSLYEQIATLLWAVYPEDPQARYQLIDTLMHLILEGGRIRRTYDLVELAKSLSSRGIQLPYPSGRSFRIIGDMPSDAEVADAQRFFRGFEATWPCIRDRVPVERTCYERKHKQAILAEASSLEKTRGLRACLIIGPRGVGKATLEKQIAFDLASHEHLVGWLDTYPRKLHKGLVPEVRRLMTTKRRVHLFAELEPSGQRSQPLSNIEHILNDLAEFLHLFGNSPKISIYLTIDSNHFEIIRDELDFLGPDPRIIRVPINLDEDELKFLIQRLRKWNSAGALQVRPDSEIFQILLRKANKILIVALVEATAGTDETDNFRAILRREYKALPIGVQLAYPMVGMSHTFNVPMPLSLLCSALSRVPGSTGAPSLEHFRADLKDVLHTRHGLVLTRHRVVAATLCQALSESGSADELLWMPMITAILKAVDEKNEEHISYLEEFAAAKVTAILTTELNTMAHALAERDFRHLSPRSRGLLLNAVVRTYQGRSKFAEAISWATQSRDEVWQDESNNADILLAYCYLSTRSGKEAINIARRLARHTSNSWHLLHAVRILCKAGQIDEAMNVYEKYDAELSLLPGFCQARGDLFRAKVSYEGFSPTDSPWAKASWVHRRLELGQLEMYQAVETLTDVLNEEPNVHRALTDCCHLLFLEGRYDEVIALADRIAAVVGEQKNDSTASSIRPAETRSMAFATKAWAIFRRDGIESAQVIAGLFQESLNLKADNAWCHNWRGMFLHANERTSGIAEMELGEAIRCNSRVPFFYRNIARIILETNVDLFSRLRNRQVIQNCRLGLNLCPPESYWNWGGLRAELESLLYYANSLEIQGVPNRTQLLKVIEIDMED